MICQRAKRLVLLCVGLLVTFLVLAACYHWLGFAVPCPLHAITGLYCPGCGTMRALLSLVRFQFYDAWRYNMLVVTLLPLRVLELGLEAWRYLKGKPHRMHMAEKVLVVVVCVIAVGFGILRNLPAFAWMAPMTM